MGELAQEHGENLSRSGNYVPGRFKTNDCHGKLKYQVDKLPYSLHLCVIVCAQERCVLCEYACASMCMCVCVCAHTRGVYMYV